MPGEYENNSPGQHLIIGQAGGEMGFILGYHKEMKYENYCKWITTHLTPGLQQRSIVVLNNAPYKTINHTKSDIQTWLRNHNIPEYKS
ncbi:hypothetical protein PR048_004117 [Dryococelus australis]|uniref:Uncharacterized protein n=1 Tax=Dryococelus australis TaxID=614101 RepID=A0ABQ9I4K9_9NEOP|nr:hypothetical protein PR048_004117 [Dryococelus australis]